MDSPPDPAAGRLQTSIATGLKAVFGNASKHRIVRRGPARLRSVMVLWKAMRKALKTVPAQPPWFSGMVTDLRRRKERRLRLQASETRLAGLIRASMDGMVTVDQARCVVLYNPAAERMFGRPAKEVIGRPVDQLFADSFHGRFLVVDEAAGDDPDDAHAPLTLTGVRGDGSEFTMEATLARHAVGKQRFVTAMLRDITERLATQTRLQQLSAAVEQSPVSIQITDAHCRICYVNKRYCAATGDRPEQVLGQSANIFNPGEMPAAEQLRLHSALASGREWCGEFHHRRQDGSLSWEFARIMPITDSAGRVAHFLVIKEDISEKKAMAERERQRQEQLAHSARLILLGEMSSSLAHEINQPLMAINGYLAACSRAVQDSPEALAWLGKIDAQVTRAGEIVWRTRDFARRHSHREAVDVAALIFSVADWVSAEARRYEITLDTGGVNGALPGICADRLQIEQVLLNLLQNAFEALRDIARARCVAVTARQASGSSELVVSVEDTGCGVPTEVAQDVFQPFFTTKPDGLGLGLAISRSIIEDHGGKLWYATTVAGTSFHFSLPTTA